MLFLCAANLGEHVLAHGVGEERATGLHQDEHQPWQDHQCDDQHAKPRPERLQPAKRAITEREHDQHEGNHQRRDRPLDENRRADHQPEQDEMPPLQHRRDAGRACGEISPRQKAEARHAERAEDGIGLRQPRLDTKQHRTSHHQRRQHRPFPAEESERGPIGQQDHRDGAKKRGQPVERDRAPGILDAERLPDPHARGLKPVDADRLLVARLLLKANVHEIAGFQHLLGSLRETRLIAVHRLQGDLPRREKAEGDEGQRQHRAQVRARHRVEQAAPVLPEECRGVSHHGSCTGIFGLTRTTNPIHQENQELTAQAEGFSVRAYLRAPVHGFKPERATRARLIASNRLWRQAPKGIRAEGLRALRSPDG